MTKKIKKSLLILLYIVIILISIGIGGNIATITYGAINDPEYFKLWITTPTEWFSTYLNITTIALVTIVNLIGFILCLKALVNISISTEPIPKLGLFKNNNTERKKEIEQEIGDTTYLEHPEYNSSFTKVNDEFISEDGTLSDENPALQELSDDDIIPNFLKDKEEKPEVEQSSESIETIVKVIKEDKPTIEEVPQDNSIKTINEDNNYPGKVLISESGTFSYIDKDGKEIEIKETKSTVTPKFDNRLQRTLNRFKVDELQSLGKILNLNDTMQYLTKRTLILNLETMLINKDCLNNVANKPQLIEICRNLGYTTKNSDTRDDLIETILSESRKLQNIK